MGYLENSIPYTIWGNLAFTQPHGNKLKFSRCHFKISLTKLLKFGGEVLLEELDQLNTLWD